MDNQEARKLLQEHRVLIAFEDDRSPLEIAHSLGLITLQNIIESTEETSGIMEANG